MDNETTVEDSEAMDAVGRARDADPARSKRAVGDWVWSVRARLDDIQTQAGTHQKLSAFDELQDLVSRLRLKRIRELIQS
jgi:hypothetical protein